MAQFEVASLWNRKSGNLKNYSNSTTKKLITKSSLDYYVCALVLAICLTLNKGFLVDALEHGEFFMVLRVCCSSEFK